MGTWLGRKRENRVFFRGRAAVLGGFRPTDRPTGMLAGSVGGTTFGISRGLDISELKPLFGTVLKSETRNGTLPAQLLRSAIMLGLAQNEQGSALRQAEGG